MGILSWARNWFWENTDRPAFDNPEELVAYQTAVRAAVDDIPAPTLYAAFPHLRTVISFLARNVQQLGLHVYVRGEGDSRERDRDSAVARLLAVPSPQKVTGDLIFATVASLALYDQAFWWVREETDGWRIDLIPNVWITEIRHGAFEITAVIVKRPGQTEPVRIDYEDLFVFSGWTPENAWGGVSPIVALRGIIAEQLAAQEFRAQVWKNGGRITQVIERPQGATWSKEARSKFVTTLRARFTGKGEDTGGTLLLEDGMKLVSTQFDAEQMQWLDGVKLSMTQIASVFHVNPAMLGFLEQANYASVREFRKALYGETLGPTISLIQERISKLLLPRLGAPDGAYVEFNLAEKLRGSFEEQAAVLSTSVGRPWMTADEARSKQNLSALGGDAAQLVTPLNVLVGGLASPRDTAPPLEATLDEPKQPETLPRKSGAVRVKAADLVKDDDRDVFSGILVRTFRRQAAAVTSYLRAKQAELKPSIYTFDGKKFRQMPEWWDAERWNKELASDLYEEMQALADRVGTEQGGQLGGEYDTGRTVNYLKEVAKRRAEMVNRATINQLVDCLGQQDESDDESEELTQAEAAQQVFDNAESVRASTGAGALTAMVAGFALTEAARQLNPKKATKTWTVTSGNPRSSHAAMDGETVPIEHNFSNGMTWPGDPVGGAEEVANCMCTVVVEVP